MWKRLALLISILLVLCLTSGAWAKVLGHWKLDEGSGTTARDSSSNANNGKLTGGPQWVTGKLGKALSFDGVDDYVEVPHSPSLIPTTGEATVSVWINARRHTGPNGNQWQGILAKGGSPRLYNLYTEASQVIHFSITGSSGSFVGPVSTGTVPLNEWVHIAVAADGAIHFYINGEPAGVGGTGAVVQTGGTAPLTIGKTDEANFFQGMIDDAWVFDNALTAEEVKALFNGNPPRWPKAVNKEPADGDQGVTMPVLQWMPGDSGKYHNVYFGETPDLGPANLIDPLTKNLMTFVAETLEPGKTYYWRVDEVEADKTTIWTGDVWKFTMLALKASAPNPADGATGLFPGVTLSWLAGRDGLSARVYFGPDKTAVAKGDPSTDKGPVTETSFSNVGELRASTTYYWRVDTVNLDTTIVPGDVWSFIVMDAGPANKIMYELWSNIGSGTAVRDLTGNPNYPNNPTSREYLDSWLHPVNAAPDADWGSNYGDRIYGWLKPPATADYTFWVAGDDETQLLLSTDASPANAVMVANVSGWTPALDFDNTGGGSGGASQKSAPINLKAGQKYFIMTLHKEGGGGDSVAVAWQGGPITAREVIKAEYVDTFSLPPLQAYRPRPANGAVDTVQTLTLTWSAGEKAQQHAVYLGDDANAVGSADASSPLFKGQRADASFDTGELEWGKTYYWRVDEINTGEAGSPWKGSVWSFTTANYIPIDDFESYTDEEVGRIFQSWIDGWGYTTPEPGNLGNGTGSTVGYTDPPFAETKVIHNGRQSMPFEYNNIDSSFIKPYYSETERTWTAAQDWTSHGMNTLSLWFRGYPISFVDKGNEAFTVSASGSDIYGTADNFRFVYKRLSGDGSIMAKVESLGNVYEYAKAGVMIRTSLTTGSIYALAGISPSHGSTFEFRQMDDSDAAGSGAWANATPKAPYWVRLTRTANVFKVETSPDAKTWTPVGTDQTILMGNSSIYIGLCVTSHNVAVPTTAEFSGVATTGGVSGSWQPVWIGADPDLTNSPANLYVAVQDSTKKIAVVSQSDLNAVLTTDWTEWQIPLSSFSGVSMNKITKMFIGVGNRDNPAADGHGKLYIDDIRVIKP